MKSAVGVGHNSRQPGAYAAGVSEFNFNSQVAEAMLTGTESVSELELKVFSRKYANSYSREVREVYRQVDAWGADASIELHFNAAGPSATGSETLSSGSTGSVALASAIQEAQLSHLGLRDRGVKVIGLKNRGGLSVKAGRAPAAITEPFFATNDMDRRKAFALGAGGFAQMYLDGLRLYAKRSGFAVDDQPDIDIPKPIPLKSTLTFAQVSKSDWLQTNVDALKGMIAKINSDSNGPNNLTIFDVFLNVYAECGLQSNGRIDINHRHSLGEKGMLPLPSNLASWIDRDVDVSTPAGNVEAFLRYLAALKNKTAGRSTAHGVNLYRGLFRATEQSDLEQARLVAAIVHGYFYPPNFKANLLPYHTIAEKVAEGDPSEILFELGYKHPTKLIRNRLANLEQAAKLLG